LLTEAVLSASSPALVNSIPEVDVLHLLFPDVVKFLPDPA
jgi:hypothetical protein